MKYKFLLGIILFGLLMMILIEAKDVVMESLKQDEEHGEEILLCYVGRTLN